TMKRSSLPLPQEPREPTDLSRATIAIAEGPTPADFPLGDTALILPPAVRARIDAWVRAGHPDETCGMLIGRRHGDRTLVTRAVQARNLAREHRRDRFDLDPVAYVMTDGEARAEGLSVVGIWHSHPDHPAVPSED